MIQNNLIKFCFVIVSLLPSCNSSISNPMVNLIGNISYLEKNTNSFLVENRNLNINDIVYVVIKNELEPCIVKSIGNSSKCIFLGESKLFSKISIGDKLYLKQQYYKIFFSKTGLVNLKHRQMAEDGSLVLFLVNSKTEKFLNSIGEKINQNINKTKMDKDDSCELVFALDRKCNILEVDLLSPSKSDEMNKMCVNAVLKS